MFEELRPDHVPAPPAGALPDAVRRGTGIRRRRRAAWAGGLAAVAVLAVGVLLGSPFSGNDTALVVPATANPTTPPDYSPIPAGATEADGVTFGFLQKVTRQPDGTLLLRFQPGFYLTGEAAKAANGGVEPLNDYVDGEKEGTVPVDLRLDPRASILASNVLTDQPQEDVTEPAPVTVEELARSWQDEAGEGSTTVWIRRADDGSVTAIREQYEP